MVTVSYRRWSFTRGSKCKALTRKNFVFLIHNVHQGARLTAPMKKFEFPLYSARQERKGDEEVNQQILPESLPGSIDLGIASSLLVSGDVVSFSGP